MSTAAAVFDEYPQLLTCLLEYREAPRWWLAVSGGADSCALAVIVAAFASRTKTPPVTVVYVDHQLHCDSAQWGEGVRDLAAQLAFDYCGTTVDVTPQGEGIEGAARRARYAMFESLLEPGDVLFTAHHQDDQLETFLMRAFRGAGLDGLGGIRQSRPLASGSLVRPLLSIPRARLVSVAQEYTPAYVTDPSNSDQHYDRGFLRERLIPLIRERWPQVGSAVGRATLLLQSASGLDLAESIDCAYARTGEPILQLKAPSSTEQVRWQIRRWLAELGLYPPSLANLSEFCRQLQSAPPDRVPQLNTGGYVLKYYAGAVYCCSGVLPAPIELQSVELDTWISTPAGQFLLTSVDASLRTNLKMRMRQASDKVRLAAGQPRKLVNKVFKLWQIPPWWRDSLPIFCLGDEIIGVVDTAVIRENCTDKAHQGTIIKIDWVPPVAADHTFRYREGSQNSDTLD